MTNGKQTIFASGVQKTVLEKLKRMNPIARSILQSIVVGALAYVGGTIAFAIRFSNQQDGSYWVLVAGGMVVVTLLSVATGLLRVLISGAEKDDRRTSNIIRSAHSALTKQVSKFTSIVRRYPTTGSLETFEHVLRLQSETVSELYNLLEHEYGGEVAPDNRVDFEVTFMTTSYKDDQITIASWANRDERAPKSLVVREKEATIYVDSETDKLFKDPNHSTRIIESTEAGDYKELYPGQKTRIKASIIYPVFRDDSVLEGTIVVHCDKESFFRRGDRKFWADLLEAYAKRLAICRVITTQMIDANLVDKRPY